MKLILDNNILFSLMKVDSSASKLFSVLNCEFIVPSFAVYEFKKYENECFDKSGLSKKEFELRKKVIFSKIKFIDFDDYRDFINYALKDLTDKDDAPYIALALKIKVPIWSNDKQLKMQNKVTILSTKDIIGLMFD